MRNKREYSRRAVVLILAVAGLITSTAPFFDFIGAGLRTGGCPELELYRQPQHGASFSHNNITG